MGQNDLWQVRFVDKQYAQSKLAIPVVNPSHVSGSAKGNTAASSIPGWGG